MLHQDDQKFLLSINKTTMCPPEVQRWDSRMAVISLVSSILGVTVFPLVGGMIGIVAGHLAINEIHDSCGRLLGEAKAKVGLWLGYGQLLVGLVALVATVKILDVPISTPHYKPPQTLGVMAAPIAVKPSTEGVKMAGEMGRDDFRLIERTEVNVNPKEIIACYNTGAKFTDPELALLTTRKFVYVKRGRITSFNLNEIGRLKDDRLVESAFEVAPNVSIYYIEVESKAGQKLRLGIQPTEGGPAFFEAIRTAVSAAGGNLAGL